MATITESGIPKELRIGSVHGSTADTFLTMALQRSRFYGDSPAMRFQRNSNQPAPFDELQCHAPDTLSAEPQHFPRCLGLSGIPLRDSISKPVSEILERL